MTEDEYLRQVLRRIRVDTGPFSLVRGAIDVLMPTFAKWGGRQLVDVQASGSFAKGTAISTGTDIDVFVSVSSATSETLRQIYHSLRQALSNSGFLPRTQNVSIGIAVQGRRVDVIPGKRHDQYSNDHSLYRAKADSWTKTNIAKHIAVVTSARRNSEIMILKHWRNQKRLDFPSFYLELATIRACQGRPIGDLANNVAATLAYIRDCLVDDTVVDPANSNNRISDDLSRLEKQRLASAAGISLREPYWAGIVQ